MKVYIASKYSKAQGATGGEAQWHEKEFNTALSVDAAYRLIKAGFTPYWPLASHYVHIHDVMTNKAETITYEQWISMDLEWLKTCDAMLVVGDIRGSKGVEGELELAQKLHMPIFTDLQELLAYRALVNQQTRATTINNCLK